MGLKHMLCRPILAGSLLLTLAGCAAPPVPFQPMKSSTDLGYGYKDTKIDASHYSVIYAGERRESAQNYLEHRAAQIARDAGFSYFSFDKQGLEVLRRSDNDLVMREHVHVVKDQGAASVNDYIPDTRRVKVTTYYYAWGQIALLSPAQAQGNAGALQVSAVLGRAGAGTSTP